MKRSHKLGLFAAGAISVLAAAAVATVATAAPTASKLVGSRVGNFMLADQTGMGHELYYFKNFDAVVVVSSEQGDATSAKAQDAIAKLQEQYKGKRVHFMMIDSGAKSGAIRATVLRVRCRCRGSPTSAGPNRAIMS